MKSIVAETANSSTATTQTASLAGAGYGAACRKVRAQIAAVREAIQAEFRQMLAIPERLIRLALDEAEALAWQTTVPQLVFPELAVEKVRAAADWNARQLVFQRSGPVYAGNH
mgnify:CR=1 FL=1